MYIQKQDRQRVSGKCLMRHVIILPIDYWLACLGGPSINQYSVNDFQMKIFKPKITLSNAVFVMVIYLFFIAHFVLLLAELSLIYLLFLTSCVVYFLALFKPTASHAFNKYMSI